MGLPNKPLSETELRRYWNALKKWDLALQKQEQELDARENLLDEAEVAAGVFSIPVEEAYNRINQETTDRPWEVSLNGVPIGKPTTFRDIEDDCTITPEEFATTIKCGPDCRNGVHLKDCPMSVYLEVERLAKLEDLRNTSPRHLEKNG